MILDRAGCSSCVSKVIAGHTYENRKAAIHRLNRKCAGVMKLYIHEYPQSNVPSVLQSEEIRPVTETGHQASSGATARSREAEAGKM